MMARRALARPVLIAGLSLAMVGLLSASAFGAPEGTSLKRASASPTARVRSFLLTARFVQAQTLLAQKHSRADHLRGPRAASRPALLAHIPMPLPITASPGKGKVIGTMPSTSRYLGQPLTAWIEDTTPNGRFGKVPVPFTGSPSAGWIRIAGLQLEHTPYSVRIDRSDHLLTVMKLGKPIMSFPAATGAPTSPTPVGRFFVTDRVPIPSGGPFGTYAFGLSGLQPNLPAGWSGGDQLAIHGTDDPGSIGTSSSAGCLRVGQPALTRLEPLLIPGTPVTVVP